MSTPELVGSHSGDGQEEATDASGGSYRTLAMCLPKVVVALLTAALHCLRRRQVSGRSRLGGISHLSKTPLPQFRAQRLDVGAT